MVPARVTASARACARVAADLLIFLVGKVRVIEALALVRGALVLTRGMPGAATDFVPFPLCRTITPIDPRVVWPVWLDEVTTAEPVMTTPWSRPEVLTSTLRVSEAPADRFPIEQVTRPDPADEQFVPVAAIPVRS